MRGPARPVRWAVRTTWSVIGIAAPFVCVGTVVGALNLAEVGLAGLLTVASAALGPPLATWTLLGVVWPWLAVQLGVLRPQLDRRARVIIGGARPPASRRSLGLRLPRGRQDPAAGRARRQRGLSDAAVMNCRDVDGGSRGELVRSPDPFGVALCGGRPLVERRREWVPLALVGALCIISGGLLAATTTSAPTHNTAWTTAYLVLVGGAAQVGLGLGRAVVATSTSAPLAAVQVAGWNLGNAAVLVGTWLGRTALVDLGGALLVATLFLLARGLRPSQAWPTGGAQTVAPTRLPRAAADPACEHPGRVGSRPRIRLDDRPAATHPSQLPGPPSRWRGAGGDWFQCLVNLRPVISSGLIRTTSGRVPGAHGSDSRSKTSDTSAWS